MKGQNLRTLYKNYGGRFVTERLTEALELGRRKDPDGLRPEDCSVREIAEGIFGNEWVKRLDPAYARSEGRGYVALQEAGGGEAVDVTAFSNIMGQIYFTRILDGWQQAGYIGDNLVDTIDTKLDGEKLPWLSRIIGAGGTAAGAYGPGEGEPIHPGMPYPEAALAEQYIDTPATTKWGEILSLTKEVIFFDRTGQMLRRAGEIGERLRYNKEKRILDCVIGATNTFKWKGTTFNTYQTAGTFWTNAQTGVPLTDWTSVEQAEILFSKITDPDTQNPIVVIPDTLVVMPAKMHTARRIVSATEIRSQTTAANPNQYTISASPLSPYQVLTSPLLYFRATNTGATGVQANDWWFIGQFKKAFAYMRNWDVTVVQAPENATASFERDVVARFKASERGVPAVIDPRYVCKMTNT
jgi:hypothetical protein